MRIERARPLLGTRVAIRVEGLSEREANRAIGEAFGEIARVHRLMSFHEADSDIGRLNREAAEDKVSVDPLTYEVLACAQEMSKLSDGYFDITIAPPLVACGMLPDPGGDRRPDAEATWRDIVLMADCRVQFRRPLWIDLGGIAKGFAVDRAVDCLRRHGVAQGAVNAGGDLRIFGPVTERVLLQPELLEDGGAPVLEIADAAVASSSGHLERREYDGGIAGPHIDGRSREPIPTDRFVSVVAESCMIADALTKIVLAQTENSVEILRHHGASAHLHRPGRGWWHFGDT